MMKYDKHDEYDKSRHDQLPWSEKYRPTTVSDLILDSTLKKRLDQIMHVENVDADAGVNTNTTTNKSIPNLILTGTSGIGKTSTVKAIVNDLYGNFESRAVLELNASNDRGVKSIQDTMTNFCKTKLIYPSGCENKYCKYKLVILDEADNMVDNRVQPQINTIMETYKNTVKFIFTCVSSSNIIEAIQSKCLIMRYMKLDKTLISQHLDTIAKKEKLVCEKGVLLKIAELSCGDMRSAINMLQLLSNNDKKIKCNDVDKLCDVPQHTIINRLFDASIKKDLSEAFAVMFELKNMGYSGSDITLGMMHTLKSDVCKLDEKHKINLLKCVCMGAYRISKGTDSLLQLASCVVDMVNIVNCS